MTDESQPRFSGYLQPFNELPNLQQRVLHVLIELPAEVQNDFLSDERFVVSPDNYKRGSGSTVFMAAPGPQGESSRSVVLKPLLDECSEEFAYYVIAHEFAHAFLRHGDGGDTTHLERDADATAAEWGFARPTR